MTVATPGRVSDRVARSLSLVRTQLGGRLLRYSTVSIISLVLSEALLVSFNGGLGWSAVTSSTVATGLATVPAYFLTRQWVWDRRGRSHLWKEVAPFWAIAIGSWAFATFSVKIAEDRSRELHLRGASSVAIVAATYVLAYAVLWMGRFILFNKVLFVDPPVSAPFPSTEGELMLDDMADVTTDDGRARDQ
jgi:putative flippase GtrA